MTNNQQDEFVACGKPEELLKLLRGDGVTCSCGKPLSPVFNAQGKKIGVTHENPEDDDWHCGYDSSLRIVVP